MHALICIDGITAPDGVRVTRWDGRSALPDDVADVGFLVPPYIRSTETIAAAVPHLPALQVVQTLSAGVDSFLPLVPDGVTLCNAKGVHDASTAELAVALALSALRDLPAFALAQDRGEWKPRSTRGLADRRVLILGYGSIGAAVERRLAGFEVEVTRVARRPREGVHGLDELPQLLPHAEVVIVLVPLTDASRGLVDAEFLAALPDGAVLVNVARGPVVDTDALLAELQSGRLLAGLDVTEPEPLPAGHPLWSAPGLVLTPHVGGGTSAMHPRAQALVTAQLARWAAGEPLENVITGDY
ncbi:phosphoglycerate dehydrogenase-like enzyme [Motilibacter rhizosphaerae]|uniref:Phosphoglycerate dehydrogenase-like enzyme n=1 Tax=Motilibacter rhizosphaerae TaxID=598652 RepID=A0A4Q7NPR6_9ACTN|nr:2-hydroxyacid dehydrogenase [Motilibacter rhizosphaerae]RZS87048.1 phosphoglycerate dehydrogenase-like enzyme [Motilibacter rhizosphaerae]